eukprot:NODE_3171_length_445_cov_56.179245_g3121_i0.p1 GENE.NODE_3171_length_445_cov_56.179245_g3121_i0~~NODE_3171_length_445_cov_56.179245_g3121_i0.p1  ORF type:complete len:124 (-),score=20.19 NODE_3171_length_445_cov_56.179245_g3121_i0:14-385(-)
MNRVVVALLAVAFTAVAGDLVHSTIACVANDAAFDLKFELYDVVTGERSVHSPTYPIDQTHCLKLKTLKGIQKGHLIQVKVHAIAGETHTLEPSIIYGDGNTTCAYASYVCRGTTLIYRCPLM